MKSRQKNYFYLIIASSVVRNIALVAFQRCVLYKFDLQIMNSVETVMYKETICCETTMLCAQQRLKTVEYLSMFLYSIFHKIRRGSER